MISIEEKVIKQQAPDPESLKDAEKLAKLSAWLKIGSKQRILWGTIKGSGKHAYQIQVDLQNLGTKCSCPSRKSPCKHALALMLLYARGMDKSLISDELPDWAAGWINERIEKQDEPPVKEKPPTVRKESSESLNKKLTSIANALHELAQWLEDKVREGIIVLLKDDMAVWKMRAARLSDAKVGIEGIRRYILETGVLVEKYKYAGEETTVTHLLYRLGSIYLFCQAFQRRVDLPINLQKELIRFAGIAPKKAEILAQEPAVAGSWQVISSREFKDPFDNKINFRRNWLYAAEANTFALIIQSEFVGFKGNENTGDQIDRSILPGSAFEGELCFYPAAVPQRAVIKSRKPENTTFKPELIDLYPDLIAMLQAYANALAHSPWLESFPAAIAHCKIHYLPQDQRWIIEDTRQRIVNCKIANEEGWKTLIITGGAAIHIFGEWNYPEFEILALLPTPHLLENAVFLLTHTA
jgi:hypothetical protein